MWRCEICETLNQDSAERCVACDAFRPSADSREHEILHRQFQHKTAGAVLPPKGTAEAVPASDIVTEDISIKAEIPAIIEETPVIVPEKPKTVETPPVIAEKPVIIEEPAVVEKPVVAEKPADTGTPEKREIAGKFDYEDDYEPVKRSRTWLWILIAVVAVVLLAGGGLLFMLGRGGNEDNTAHQPGTATGATAGTEATAEITAEPTAEITAEPTEQPGSNMLLPTAEPTAEPTEEPTPEPTAEPTAESSAAEGHYIEGLEQLANGNEEAALYSFMQAEGYEDAEVYVRDMLAEGGNAIATGNMHSIWIADGRAMVNGNNFYSQCEVGAWPGNLVQVAAGNYHSVGLSSDGSVWFAGDNYYGQIFDRGWQGVKAIAAGSFHTVALMSDGSVAATGQDVYGQCAVNSWSGITAIAAGERHTVALRSDGTVAAAGDNSFGQLNVSGWTDIVQISCGEYHTVGLKADGTVVAAGLNESGQCDTQAVTGAVYVTAGSDYTLCVMQDGGVMCITTAEGTADMNSWRYPLRISAAAGHSLGMFPDGSLMLGGSYYETMEQGANARMDIYDVVTLQRALLNRGYTEAAASGQYNAQTAQAVSAAQEAMGLEPTGIADAEFQTMLYSIYMK